MKPRVFLFGSAVKKALEKVGITEERIEKWVGHGCRCGERRRKLDRLSVWASHILQGKAPPTDEELARILEEAVPPK